MRATGIGATGCCTSQSTNLPPWQNAFSAIRFVTHVMNGTMRTERCARLVSEEAPLIHSGMGQPITEIRRRCALGRERINDRGIAFGGGFHSSSPHYRIPGLLGAL